MKTLFAASVVFCAFTCTGLADTCDPNSDVPLAAFSIMQDMRQARQFYKGPTPIICNLGINQEARMTFNPQDGDYKYYVDRSTVSGFSCFVQPKGGMLKNVAVTSRILVNAFAGTSVKLSDCKYSIAAAEPPSTQVYDKKKNEDGSLNLQTNERRLIVKALEESQGDKSLAAKKLGLSQEALQRKIKDNGIQTTAH